jgi:hypothetical protein
VSTTEQKVILGKVAKLVNEEELVFTGGTDAGVTTGMTFWVLDEATQHVKDPDTDEDLGGVIRTKVRLNVIGVGPHVSLAERHVPASLTSSVSTYSILGQPPPRKQVGETAPAAWPEGVRVGDRVIGEKKE